MNKIPKTLIKDIIEEIDYDIASGYDEETAEEPEYVQDRWDSLEVILNKYGFTLNE